jgi:exopolysaccharide production protein ExoQ
MSNGSNIQTRVAGSAQLARSVQFFPTSAPSAYSDWVLCSVSMTALLSSLWAGTHLPGGTAAALLLFIVPWIWIVIRNIRAAARAVRSNWPILLFPLFALLSTAWSEVPEWTLRAGLQYLLTVIIGILAGVCVKPQVMLWALVSAGVFVVLAGLFVGEREYYEGSLILIGLFGSKNYFGLCVALLLLAATVVTFDKSQPAIVRLVAFVTMALTPIVLVFSRSVGALVCALSALLLTAMIALLFRFPPLVRLAALVLVVPLILMAWVVWLNYGSSDSILTSVGKDVTLTGRTWLWQWADMAISEKPVLGVGYEAYWRPNNWGAEEIWLHDQKASKTGYHFHNTILQVTVDLGYVGLVVFLATLTAIAGRIGSRILFSQANAEQIFAIAAFAFLLLRLPLEVDIIWQFQIPTVIVSLIWVYLAPTRRTARAALS